LIERALKLAPADRLLVLKPPVARDEAAAASFDAVLLYSRSRAELESGSPLALRALKPGGKLWVAYPRPGNGPASDLMRDHGWGALHAAGLTSVEQRGLDAGWDLQRFAAAPPAAVPAADLLPVGRRATPTYRAVRLLLVPLLKLAFRFRAFGRENIPTSGAYVVIANHLGWLDALTLLIVFPVEPRIHFVADPTGMMRRRLEWALIRAVGGIVPVDRAVRGDTRLYRHVLRCLELGGAVALFPEGDVGPREGELQPFKKGFAHFAASSGAPVVPVALTGPRDVWLGKRIEARIGPPITPAGKSVDELHELGRRAVAELLPAYVEPPGPKPLRRWLTGLF
jgi:1-acyl-sn-glycerol-3-phosphate acyltransferase